MRFFCSPFLKLGFLRKNSNYSCPFGVNQLKKFKLSGYQLEMIGCYKISLLFLFCSFIQSLYL